MSRRAPHGPKLALFATALLLGAVAVGLFGLRHLGRWLELQQPPRKSIAIVVLGGGVPFRAAEAAKLYREGWAKEVWLTQGTLEPKDRALAQIGLAVSAEHETNRLILEKLGVPAEAIQLVPGAVDNTLSELQAIIRYAQNRPPGSLIIVTSPSHTRRVQVIWSRVAPGGRTALTRYSPEEPFEADHWWRTTTDALTAFREAFGIVNAWAGFPIAPRER